MQRIAPDLMEWIMKKLLALAAVVAGLAAPVVAQAADLTCADFSAADDAGKQAMAPQIKELEPVATLEPLMSQDAAELIVSTTQACNEYPTALVTEALSQFANALDPKK